MLSGNYISKTVDKRGANVLFFLLSRFFWNFVSSIWKVQYARGESDTVFGCQYYMRDLAVTDELNRLVMPPILSSRCVPPSPLSEVCASLCKVLDLHLLYCLITLNSVALYVISMELGSISS